MLNNDLYVLLDAASSGIEAIDEAASLSNEAGTSLYFEQKGSQLLNSVAPYLFSAPDEVKNWFLENGWGNSWGFMVKAELPLDKLRLHFKKFLKVRREDFSQYYFRFYDPRVLRIFLPTCNTKQLQEFFGPVDQFICEDTDPDFGLVFTFDENNLMTTRINKGDIL